MTTKEWTAWEARMTAPPPELARRPDPMTIEQEGRQFMAFYGAVTGAPPSV